ncbi:MAG: hypothetical protein IPJ85_12140 [Flavobacteriales bacterium]|nr:hypothetical protein [Flavobacteriales bacterium]
MASIVILSHRSLATDLLVRRFAQEGMAPSLVVLEEAATMVPYRRSSRIARRWLGDDTINRILRLRLSLAARAALRWEQVAKTEADAFLLKEAEDRNLIGEPVDCPVIITESINAPSTVQRIRLAKPDLLIVFGTRLLRSKLISLPRHGAINMHSSLLPFNRGSMPEFWQCMHGDLTHAGVTFHLINAAVDAGDILQQLPARQQWPVTPQQLRAVNVLMTLKAYPEVAGRWLQGLITPQPQPANSTPPHRLRDLTVERRIEIWHKCRSATSGP